MVHKGQSTTRVYELPQTSIDLSEIIAVMNNKGGTAKSTTALTLALYLVRIGKRVALLDFDAQTNVTQRLGIPDTEFKDRRVNMLFKTIDADNFESRLMNFPIVVHYPYFYRASSMTDKIGTLSIVPGSQDATYTAEAAYEALSQAAYTREDPRSLHDRFVFFLDQLRRYNDYIIIDTAPALSGNVLNQLAASVADEIICPVDGLEAAKGLTNLISWIDRETRPYLTEGKRPNVTFAITKYQEDTEDLRNIFTAESGLGVKNVIYRVMKAHFREFVCDAAVKEMQRLKNNVYDGFGKKNNIYDPLSAEIVDRIHSPRPDIFEYYKSHMAAFERDLRTINRVSLHRAPQLLIPKYISGEVSDSVTKHVDDDA